MPSLSLNLFGLFDAHLDGHPIPNLGVKSQALLIYLAVDQRPQRREQLLTILWPGMPERSARHNLSQAIYALRQVFPEDTESPLLLVDRQTVQLNPTATILVDLHQFDRLLSTTQTHRHQNLVDCSTCIEALEQVNDLYRGDFISDFYLEDSNEFDEWAEAVREDYRRKWMEALATLSDIAMQVGDYEQALNCIERQLITDNLSERAHRQKMEMLALAGRRVEAMRQYRELTQLLAVQLGVEPSQETTALFKRIRSEDLTAKIPAPDVEPTKTRVPRNNLVPQPTPFIGRQDELAQLDEMLRNPDIRLITIVAPGGMGKTRLAIAAAERQLVRADNGNESRYPDGVYFVPLAPLSAPDQIAPAIASALNLPVDGGPGLARSTQAPESTLDRLTAYLCEKQILLVLDNFEHLLAGVELLPELLQSAPSLNILVTTRERLHLQEEQVLSIVGLRFPDWEAPEEPRNYTAMELFLQNARRVRPDFDLKPGDMIYLTRVCNLVGGMPLALELAAAWVKVLSPAEIAAEIRDSLDFLASDLRNLPERHRSMRAVCNAAWERLTSKEQVVFQRLSVFRGGFSRTAAQKVCDATLADLAMLVDKAIIQYESSAERYQIHELLRQYSAEKLAKNAETEKATRDGHSTYFCCKARELGDEHLSGKHREALNGFEVDLVNFQNGWDWAIKQSCYENLYNAIIGLVGYFDWILQVQKSREICQSAVNMLESQGVVDESQAESPAEMVLPLRLYALAIGARGYCNFFFNPSQAKEDIAHSLHILDHLLAQNHDARYEKAIMLWFLGLFEFQYGEQEAAYGILLESLALSREIECSWLIEYVLIWVGAAAALRGNQQDARKWWQQLLVEACKLDDPAGQLWAYDCLGGLAWDVKEYEQSEALFEQGWRVARQHNDHPEGINVLTSLSNLMLFLGKLEQALAKYGDAVDFATKTNQLPRVVNCLTNKGIAQWLSGDLVQAGITIEEALFFGKQHTSNLNVYAITGHAEWLALTGDYRRADVCVQILKSTPDELHHERYMLGPYLSGRFRQTLGWIALGQQQYAKAESHFERSIEIFQNISNAETTAWSQAGLAWAEIGLGNWEIAHQLLTEALTTAIHIQGYTPMVFTLPITLLILVRENSEIAAHVYQQVRSDPFMSNAQLFHDLVYKHLPDAITALPFELVKHSPEHREKLWITARLALEKMMQEQVE